MAQVYELAKHIITKPYSSGTLCKDLQHCLVLIE